jgi:hypothetical protein
MISSALDGARAEISTLRAEYGVKQELDTRTFYNLYCNQRLPPPRAFLNSTQAVGMALMRSPIGLKHVSYVAFFIPQYGAWLPSVASILTIVEFLDMLYGKGISLVVFDDNARRDLERLVRGKMPLERLPTVENVKEDQDIFAVAWSRLNVDALSWILRANRARLSENPPKNPIEYSFRSEWKLRWEQMVYTAMCSMLALAIATTPDTPIRRKSL